MGIETAIIATAVVSAAGSVYGGMQAKKQAKKQAMMAEEQANIQAVNEEKKANSAARLQKMAFIKSGVGALTGSPLMVMEETYDTGKQNAYNIRKAGVNQANYYRDQGDAAMTQGIVNGFKSVGGAFLQMQDMGALNTPASGPMNTAANPGFQNYPNYAANNAAMAKAMGY